LQRKIKYYNALFVVIIQTMPTENLMSNATEMDYIYRQKYVTEDEKREGVKLPLYHFLTGKHLINYL